MHSSESTRLASPMRLRRESPERSDAAPWSMPRRDLIHYASVIHPCLASSLLPQLSPPLAHRVEMAARRRHLPGPRLPATLLAATQISSVRRVNTT